LHRGLDPRVFGIVSIDPHERAIGARGCDHDAAGSAQRDETGAVLPVLHGIHIAARRTGTACFGNIIVLHFFDFFLARPATRRARACRREHGGVHAIGCGACHGRQVAGGTRDSRATIFASLG
jgi:hypothetical protein